MKKLSRKKNPKVEAPKLSSKHIQALFFVAQGADVYDYSTAGVLREIQKLWPDLVEIGRAQMYTGDGTDQTPYFGAIATKKGRELVCKAVKGKLEVA